MNAAAIAKLEKDLFDFPVDRFVRAHPHPCLLVAGVDAGFEADAEYHTTLERSDAAHEVIPFRVLPLVKRATSVFRRRIFVGRTSTNDVVIGDARVSKVHAFFELDERDAIVAVGDAGSTNGTRVDGAPVPARASVPVRFGQMVALGPFIFRYVSAEQLYALRHRVAVRQRLSAVIRPSS